MMTLSDRLRAVAALVDSCSCLCDMGCDHAYLSVYLVQQGVAARVIATDVGEGPLQRAERTVLEAGLSDRIETRLSDGADAISPGEIDSCVIAGMGGMLMERILDRGMEVFRNLDQLVLSPHSDLPDLRSFLYDRGFEICAEDMVKDAGKYYPMMRVVYRGASGREGSGLDQVGIDKDGGAAADERDISMRYGPCLLGSAHPVLYEYLQQEKEKLETAIRQAKNGGAADRTRSRIRELERELYLNNKARERYDMQ